MPLVRLYQHVEHSDHFGSGTLYHREIITDFVPRKGERVTLFRHEGEEEPPFHGPMNTVKETYWDAYGMVCCDLEHYVVDPSEQMEQHIKSSFSLSNPLHGWYSDRDGDFDFGMRAGGWTTD